MKSGTSQCNYSLRLSTVLQKRPHTPFVKTLDEKTQALKIMSLDMASNGKIE